MINRIKVWYAKQSDYDLRRLAIFLSVFAFIGILSVLLLWEPLVSSDEVSLGVERSFRYAEMWEEDRESVLILGGLLIFSLLFMTGMPTKFSEIRRRNHLATKHPWTRKRD